MDRHALHRMYVLPFELRPNETMIMGEIPEASVASANTHDLPTFAGWWEGTDIEVRREMGLLDDEACAAEVEGRHRFCDTLADRLGQPREPGATLRASLEAMAASNTRLLLVNLEDLWLSKDPQNVPGTHRERPNWRQKAGLSLEEMRDDERVTGTLRAIDDRRKKR
jgi:4-alpha-glucanotransferase